jgi:hypothetical protein
MCSKYFHMLFRTIKSNFNFVSYQFVLQVLIESLVTYLHVSEAFILILSFYLNLMDFLFDQHWTYFLLMIFY